MYVQANASKEYKHLIQELKTKHVQAEFGLEGKEIIDEESQEAPNFDSIQQEYQYWHLMLKHPY